MTYHAKVIAGGKIVIPADIRRLLGIKDGDPLVVSTGPGGEMVVRTHEQVIADGQRAFRSMLKRPFTVDEFLADRRMEEQRD